MTLKCAVVSVASVARYLQPFLRLVDADAQHRVPEPSAAAPATRPACVPLESKAPRSCQNQYQDRGLNEDLFQSESIPGRAHGSDPP